MEPIRIAHIMGKMLYGGTESVVMNYYRHIDRSKVQFDFIADGDSKMPIPRKEEIESMGGRIFIVPPYQKINEYIPALINLFKEQDYKIVHAHLNTLNVFPLYAAKKAGVPVRISHSHSTAAAGETKKNILKYMLRPFARIYPTHFAACSRYAGEWLFGKRLMESERVIVLNNAIDLEKYKFDESVRIHVRKELQLEDKFVLGHVGRFCYQKNQEFVVDVFKEVYWKEPNAALLFIGEGEDLEMIKSKVHALQLDNAVVFIGNCSDVSSLYQAMDVLLFPSRYEGLGLVAVEAQMCGVKVIASTEVPIAAKASSRIEFLDLNDSVERWAEAVLKKQLDDDNGFDFKNQIDFDITRQADKLLRYYNTLIES